MPRFTRLSRADDKNLERLLRVGFRLRRLLIAHCAAAAKKRIARTLLDAEEHASPRDPARVAELMQREAAAAAADLPIAGAYAFTRYRLRVIRHRLHLGP